MLYKNYVKTITGTVLVTSTITYLTLNLSTSYAQENSINSEKYVNSLKTDLVSLQSTNQQFSDSLSQLNQELDKQLEQNQQTQGNVPGGISAEESNPILESIYQNFNNLKIQNDQVKASTVTITQEQEQLSDEDRSKLANLHNIIGLDETEVKIISDSPSPIPIEAIDYIDIYPSVTELGKIIETFQDGTVSPQELCNIQQNLQMEGLTATYDANDPNSCGRFLEQTNDLTQQRLTQYSDTLTKNINQAIAIIENESTTNGSNGQAMDTQSNNNNTNFTLMVISIICLYLAIKFLHEQKLRERQGRRNQADIIETENVENTVISRLNHIENQLKVLTNDSNENNDLQKKLENRKQELISSLRQEYDTQAQSRIAQLEQTYQNKIAELETNLSDLKSSGDQVTELQARIAELELEQSQGSALANRVTEREEQLRNSNWEKRYNQLNGEYKLLIKEFMKIKQQLENNDLWQEQYHKLNNEYRQLKQELYATKQRLQTQNQDPFPHVGAKIQNPPLTNQISNSPSLFETTNISGDKVSLTKETSDNVWKGVTNRIEFTLDSNGEYIVSQGERGQCNLYLNPNSRINPEAIGIWKKAKLFTVKGNLQTKSFNVQKIVPAKVVKSADGWILNQSGEITLA